MKKNILKSISLVLISSAFAVSCTGDLDRFPTNDTTAEIVYSTYNGYVESMAKVYGAYTLPGNTGPAGNPDVSGLDEGSNADFLRGFWNLQELPTDEAKCAWIGNDPGISDLNNISWTSENPFSKGLYYRCIVQIKFANEFLKYTTDEVLASKGFSDVEKTEIRYFASEARFLRAFQYWVLMDLFANPPFIDENSPTGKFMPEQISRVNLYSYVENELLDVQNSLKDPRQNEYGRADKAAAWALLARLYLNSEVYIGQKKYTEAITYSSKVLTAGYTLKTKYEELFLADNNLNNPEVILSINYDGNKTRSYGGTHFIINSSFNSLSEIDYGMTTGGWGGNRTTKALTNKFADGDSRYLFTGDTDEIESISSFVQGLSTYKFRNVTSKGEAGSFGAYADTDFPLFRLAEMNLVYAESVLRGGVGGSETQAVRYMNMLQERAFGNEDNNFPTLNLSDIIDERARELYWEGFRRTDLIRFGYLTSNAYLWPWKGGSKNGRAVSSNYIIYPIPASDLMANTNLKQNTGY